MARQYKAVNLGQGAPDWETPQFVKDAAKTAIDANLNQYAMAQGSMRLRTALAAKYTPLLDRTVDPETDIVVTNGTSQALQICMTGLLAPGDEAIIMEPAFDLYGPQVRLAGAQPRYIPLRWQPTEATANAAGRQTSRAWTLDLDELRGLCNERTKVFLLNTPQNPTGKVFSRDELTAIADVIRSAAPNCIVVADEVYEHMVFDGTRHERMATIPGMGERTLTLSSAGKTFSCTGWKIGWVIGPKEIVASVAVPHIYGPFCVSAPFQDAVGAALEAAEKEYEGKPSFYAHLLEMYTGKRDVLMRALTDAGLDPIEPEGTFFIMANIGNVDAIEPEFLNAEDKPARDYAFCRWLTQKVGVAAIPPTAFYIPEHRHVGENFARFAFCKTDEALVEASKRLATLQK